MAPRQLRLAGWSPSRWIWARTKVVAGTGPWAVLPDAEPSAPPSSSPSLSQSNDMSAPPGKLKSPNRSGSLANGTRHSQPGSR
eukprot:scaffold6128_cov147-Isochrysis_galbana.AAC.3